MNTFNQKKEIVDAYFQGLKDQNENNENQEKTDYVKKITEKVFNKDYHKENNDINTEYKKIIEDGEK